MAHNSPPSSPIRVLAISPGIAIGPISLRGTGQLSALEAKHVEPRQVEAELQRLQEALDAAIQELREVSAHVARTVGRNEAEIFEAQQLMLEDPDLLELVQLRIKEQHQAAASALQQVAEEQARELEALDDPTLSARGVDIRDAAGRAIRHLVGDAGQVQNVLSVPSLIVARDLTPSDTAHLDPALILGICTVVGGPTTHAAIIARALELPAVAGLDPHLLEHLHDGQQIAIDGTRGLLYLEMTPEQQQELNVAMRQQREERARRQVEDEAYWHARPGSTADDVHVQVFANVGDAEGARAAAEAGAEGIGLLRTEFLFGGRSVFPDEQEQFENYLTLFRAFGDYAALGKTIIARTLDAGADKPFPALEPLIGKLEEANPALGLRGVRIHLVQEELLRQQLRALLRAGVEANIHLHIMFPMIATLEEVRRVRGIYNNVRMQLQAEGKALPTDVRLGIMVETPAAALMADVLAREVDFFSIGANDLYQYTMAVDRTNSRVTALFGLLEPAVWRLIAQVARAGASAGKLVAVCGELAADTRIGPLLVGLGVQELSMSPPAITRVKAGLHRHPLAYWQQQASALLTATTAEEALLRLQALASSEHH